MEFRGGSRRPRGGCSDQTMVRDICHAWLHSPSPTMGPGGGGREWGWPAVAFFSVPSFPGTLLSLTMGLLCLRRFFFFLPTFNPSSLLLFLPLVSGPPPQPPLRENKTKTKKTQLKVRLFIPPLLFVRRHRSPRDPI